MYISAEPLVETEPYFGLSAHRVHGWTASVEKALEAQRDRLPLFAPIGLSFGILSWQAGGEIAFWPLAFACLAALIFAAISGQGRRLSFVLIWGAVLSGLGFSAIAIKSRVWGTPAIAHVWIGNVAGRIESAENIAARENWRLVLNTAGRDGLPNRVRMNVPSEQYRAEYAPGATIRAKVRLMPPPGPDLPNGYDFARTAWFSGIGATGSTLGSIELVKKSDGGAFWATTRAALSEHIMASMTRDSGPIGAGLLVGTQGAITADDATAMRNSGLAHLLSVSGLHVTAVVGAAFIAISRVLALFPWFALRFPVPIFAAAGSGMVAILYTLLTGAQVPTIRSCIAALLILAALMIGRQALSLRLLAAGASAILVFWPEALVGPSFQLSFAAVATIIILHESDFVQKLVGPRDESIFRMASRWLLSLFITGVAIELALAPIALFHFHKSGLFGAAANIFAIPLTTFVVMPAQILGLVGDAVVQGGGRPFWWVAVHGVNSIRYFAHIVGDAPSAVLALPNLPGWAFGCVVGGAVWVAIWQGRARWLGLLPIVLGGVAMSAAPRPDILITADGRHMAVVDRDGTMAILRQRVGDYALSMLTENAATKVEPIALDLWPGAQCNEDFCVVSIERAGRKWSILATRSTYQVAALELADACSGADIVVSERFLPRLCQPRWFKADRSMLTQTGGLAIYFAQSRVDTVADDVAGKPWSRLGLHPRQSPHPPSAFKSRQ